MKNAWKIINGHLVRVASVMWMSAGEHVLKSWLLLLIHRGCYANHHYSLFLSKRNLIFLLSYYRENLFYFILFYFHLVALNICVNLTFSLMPENFFILVLWTHF